MSRKQISIDETNGISQLSQISILSLKNIDFPSFCDLCFYLLVLMLRWSASNLDKLINKVDQPKNPFFQPIRRVSL